MQIHSLTNAIFSIEKMVGTEGQSQQLSLQLHKLIKTITSFGKLHETVLHQNRESQKEKKQLQKKIKKTVAKLEKKEQECVQLRCQLTRLKDVYEHKISKLTKLREFKPHEEMIQANNSTKGNVSRFRKTKEIQCQIWNEQFVKELEERNLYLLRKINKLEQALEEQKNENNSRQLYIESLQKALSGQMEEQTQSDIQDSEPPPPEEEVDCQDINDVSTIDADSLKGEDHQSDIFPQTEKKLWEENQFQQGWRSSITNIFNKVKTVITKIWKA